jgi:hypothetical protein
MLSHDSLVRRPDIACETCPRRLERPPLKFWQRVMGKAQLPEIIDKNCFGPQRFITSGTVMIGNAEATSEVFVRVNDGLDCTKMYPDVVDWNISFLRGLMNEIDLIKKDLH